MNNRFGINLWNWENNAYGMEAQLMSSAAAAGYSAVEIGLNEPEIDTEAVKELMQEKDLEVSLCAFMAGGRDLSNFDTGIRKNTKAYITGCIKTAGKIGAEIFAGPLFAGGGKAHLLNQNDKRREWDLAVAGLREMADVAADCGVRLCIEPINRYRTSVVNTVGQSLEMLENIGKPNVGILFDTFHANIEEADVSQALEQVLKARKLFHFHASDSSRDVPGTGHIDWKGVFSALGRYAYSGHITIETFRPGGLDSGWTNSEEDRDRAAKAGLDYMKKFAKF